MISIRNLHKHYLAKAGTRVEVLRDINLEVPDRTITAVIGALFSVSPNIFR
jgi:ABC-type methionine transport system ATPase subunit